MNIKPGMKCVIVNTGTSDDGKIVTVLEFASPPGGWVTDSFGDMIRSRGYNLWAVDCGIKIEGLSGEVFISDFVPEYQLKPIDDDRQIKTWDSMKDIWSPEPNKADNRLTEKELVQ